MFFIQGKNTARLILFLISAYAAAYLLFFWQTPLGMTPVLDGAENVKLANSIFSGGLPAEPFYRAMLYPAFLAIFRLAGISADDLHFIAGLTGIITHILTSIIISLIALRLWKSEKTAYLAMLLYGLHPPAVFFAAEPLDITAGLLFLSASLLALLTGDENDSRKLFAVSGALLGIGSIIRANMLPMAGTFLFFSLKQNRRQHSFMAILALLLIMFCGGGINYLHSGQFRMLPWQGGFSLYAANFNKANGKYFNQTLYLPDRDPGINPARLESELIYFRETGKNASKDIESFNSFWKTRLANDIKASPGDFVFLLMRKTWYLLNNFEQYNNKTFAFHKAISPVLRLNPLCFGLLFIMTVTTVLNCDDRKKLQTVFISASFIAAGIVAFFVSARFRILLLPFMVPIASGIAVQNITSSSRFLKNAIIIAISAILTFNTFFSAADTSTFNSDRLLIAHAAGRLNLYDQQLFWSDEVLKTVPNDIQAIRLKLVAFTNLALSGNYNGPQDWKIIEKELKHLRKLNLSFFDTLFIDGCYSIAVEKNRMEAIAKWKRGLEDSSNRDLFMAALIFNGETPVELETINSAEASPFLKYILENNQAIKTFSGENENKKVLNFLFCAVN